ncbi:MAG: hypothetical protein H6Q26_18 [Bacteroidetes bacterium]|uniref:hypothetical protein n=1 Tax=unclassified Chitinophaga TaxID=2619133 RepID=UPI0009D1B355|nr:MULTISPECIES: hypothetical protein [unclassified Chitinophaga]MBP1649861.1 hypothetical protein [Bacteroidota bacterium]OMP76958.1 hypothetical protein BW716_22525 [[Flexibacter] sp. ATCC 35208]WPV64520.1 hypothetical protein QQL36_22205 [Chitinophaga sp. LS1]
MRVIFFVLALTVGVSSASAQTSVKVVHEYYNNVYEKFNADVVRVLHLVRDTVMVAPTLKQFFYIRADNGNKLTLDYQLYEDSRIISVQITGQTRDVVTLYAALYDRKIKKKKPPKGYVIKNDEWVRIQTDNVKNTSKIIIQAIIY